MTQNSPALTDPARELADMLVALQTGDTKMAGDQYLAAKFEVEPWSQDFFRVIATIMDRLAFLRATVSSLPLDEDFRAEMVQHVDDVCQAFTPNGFQNAWANFAMDKLSARNVQPLKGLSGLVRQTISYPRLGTGELDDLADTVDALLSWLRDQQLREQDFIRQAMIEGLESLQFRLVRFQWLGWGYTMGSLKEVIGAYMLLERQDGNIIDNPDAAVILKKVGEVIKKVYEKLKVVKTAADTGDWVLRAYGAAAVVQHLPPAVKGLLGSG